MEIEKFNRGEAIIFEINCIEAEIKRWKRFCGFESIELNYTKDGKPNQSFTLRDDNLKKLIDAEAIKKKILSDLESEKEKLEIEFASL